MEAAAGALAGGQAPRPHDDQTAGERGRLERLRVLAAAALRLAPECLPDCKALSLLGLDSLAAAELRHGIAETWAVELELEQVLSGPTLEELAQLIALRVRESTAAAPATSRPCSIAGRLPRTAGAGGESAAVLSFAQERLWFLDQLEPGSAVYNQPAALRLAGPLDVAALTASLDEVRRRHEVLRTRFVARAGGVSAVVAAAPAPCKPVAAHRGRAPALPRLPLIDLTPLPAGRGQALAERLTVAEALRPFDLAAGPPLRVALLRLGGNGSGDGAAAEHRLLLTLHHIAADGWSFEVLARELGALYAAAVSGMPPAAAAVPRLLIQYSDFARWQRARFAGDTLAAEVGWWREQLAGPRGAPPPLDLPLDRPRPAAPSSRGARCLATLPADLAGRLAALAQRGGATRFMALLAALAVLLGRMAGTADLAIGIAAANRGRRDVRDLIGLFVNTLVIRVDLGGDPGFDALLARVRHAAQGAYAHQEAPFDKVVGELAPRRALAEVPLFRVFFAQQPTPPALALPGLAVEHLDVQTGTAKLDLSLAVSLPAAGTIRCAWTWRTDLFETATMARLASQFENLLRAIVDRADRRLSELPLLGPAEHHQLLVEWSTAPSCAARELARGGAVHELFAAQAARRPRAAAVRAGAAELTYGELARRAAAVAAWLHRRGVGPEVVVGLWMDRSVEAVVGMLGIFMAGGVYLPLDPAYPAERLEQSLAAAGATALLTQAAMAPRLPPLARRLPRLELAAGAAGLPEPDT
ncbi:MAG TPA: condensation domain-containing protein, partial [Thermoanaerobaculia bacterium]|nr:condensation domain-containing protein [Thermoanaerobaculia bacterium]